MRRGSTVIRMDESSRDTGNWSCCGPRGARTRNLWITGTRQGSRRESIEIRTYCLTRMTNARTEAANLHAKNIKRAGRGYVNHHNYRARILLAATVKNAE